MITKIRIEGFEGAIEFKLPKFKERIEELKKYGFNNSADGVMPADDTATDTIDKMIELLNSRIIKIDLTHTESGMTFTSLDELEYYEEFGTIINEISSIYAKGVSLGNVQKA